MTYISDPTSICFVPSPIAPSLPLYTSMMSEPFRSCQGGDASIK